ncbi:hypothetical protein CC2G_013054 [Coprinopsis cinerea AmutBmut pab1-1]|nr:hypothetical protein CC2G_013054 [Coprinopsis cinerea AmutBmut pab1-1]
MLPSAFPSGDLLSGIWGTQAPLECILTHEEDNVPTSTGICLPDHRRKHLTLPFRSWAAGSFQGIDRGLIGLEVSASDSIASWGHPDLAFACRVRG